MKKQQAGFTLIELIAVIVILGILAAVAVPRFIDMSAEAETAALGGVAGGMSSAMAVNYAGCSAVGNDTTDTRCVAVTNCSNVNDVLVGGTPDGYTVTAAAITDNGTAVACTVTQDATGTAGEFTGIGAGQ